MTPGGMTSATVRRGTPKRFERVDDAVGPLLGCARSALPPDNRAEFAQMGVVERREYDSSLVVFASLEQQLPVVRVLDVE